MISVDVKLSPFNEVCKMLDSRIHCQELMVESAVRLLCLVQLLRDKTQRLPLTIKELVEITTPIAIYRLDALVVRQVVAVELGWMSKAVVDKASFMASKAD